MNLVLIIIEAPVLSNPSCRCGVVVPCCEGVTLPDSMTMTIECSTCPLLDGLTIPLQHFYYPENETHDWSGTIPLTCDGINFELYGHTGCQGGAWVSDIWSIGGCSFSVLGQGIHVYCDVFEAMFWSNIVNDSCLCCPAGTHTFYLKTVG